MIFSRRIFSQLGFFTVVTFSCISVFSANIMAAAPSGYYSSVDSSNSSSLRSTLHPVIDDHTRYPYSASSTDTWDILEAADQDADNASNVTTIYKNASYAKQGGGNNYYNREHSWPKSYGFPNDGSSNYPYTDAHHLFLADSSYNSARGNEYFDNCTSGCTEKTTVYNDGQGGSGDSNYTDSDSWQVWSKRKGDIARAMFYMDIRYEGGYHSVTGASEPDLILTNNANLINATGGNASVAYMGLLSVLLQWHQQDPVSSDEMQRNDVVYGFQGNRNPFVDHPEWVACLYQNNCSGGGTGGGTGGGSSSLNNGDSISGLSGGSGEWQYFTLEVPANASNLQISLSGGSGDGDLYVRFGSRPTSSSYDCRPWQSGNNETCSFSSPSQGTYYIAINGYSSYSGASLSVNYSTGSTGGGSGGASEEHSGLSAGAGDWLNYSFQVPSGASSLNVTMSGGSGDGDLYVRRGSLPTQSTYDCRPYEWGNDESCSFTNPASGTWYISIYGYQAFSGITLNYSYAP